MPLRAGTDVVAYCVSPPAGIDGFDPDRLVAVAVVDRSNGAGGQQQVEARAVAGDVLARKVGHIRNTNDEAFSAAVAEKAEHGVGEKGMIDLLAEYGQVFVPVSDRLGSMHGSALSDADEAGDRGQLQHRFGRHPLQIKPWCSAD